MNSRWVGDAFETPKHLAILVAINAQLEVSMPTCKLQS